MSVEALSAPQIDSAVITADPADISHDNVANEDDALGAVFDTVSKEEISTRDANGRFTSANAAAETGKEPLEGGEGGEPKTGEISTPPGQVPLPSNWRGKEDLWGKIPTDLREPIRAHQEELHKTLSQQGQALSAYKPLSDVLTNYKDYFGGERGNYKPHEAVEYLFSLQRQMDDDPVNTLLSIADTYELRPHLQKMFGGAAGEGGQAAPNESALLAKISQLESTIRTMGDPSKIDQRITQKLDEVRAFGEVDSLVSRLSPDMPLYEEIPEPDLVSFIHMAKQKLGGAASQEAVLKRAYDMAVNADPDLRAKAAALKTAASSNPDQIAAAKRANQANLRSTSTGKTRQLTQEEELGAVFDKLKGN
jgi:hypothetical protein